MVPCVPISPDLPLRVIDMALRTVGPITSTTGTSSLGARPEHRGAGRVAGDDEHLDALLDHAVEDLQGESP